VLFDAILNGLYFGNNGEYCSEQFPNRSARPFTIHRGMGQSYIQIQEQRLSVVQYMSRITDVLMKNLPVKNFNDHTTTLFSGGWWAVNANAMLDASAQDIWLIDVDDLLYWRGFCKFLLQVPLEARGSMASN
jgi:hypothetical protein